MAGINFKGGLTRSRSKTGGATQRLSPYPIKNGKAKNFFSGDPVRVSNGTLEIGVNTSPVLGVAVAFQWLDDGSKQPVWRGYFPSGTSAAPGYFEGFRQPFALVDDDPLGTWVIKADTTVAVSSLGALALANGAGTGSTATGRSAATVSIAGTATSAGNAMFRIVNVYRIGEATSAGPSDNNWDNTGGTAGTIVEVVFSNHLYN